MKLPDITIIVVVIIVVVIIVLLQKSLKMKMITNIMKKNEHRMEGKGIETNRIMWNEERKMLEKESVKRAQEKRQQSSIALKH